MTRHTFVASVVCVSAVAAIGSVTGLSAGQQTSETPAAARNYWAFKLPVQAPLPDISGRFEHPIDRFLEQARQEKGLTPAPRAARLTLVRRAYLDLIGLPPSPAESAAFLADTAPGAWERLIDTLLASPHYGERWGRHWLDVARYADSSGFEQDYDRPNAWRYRDYVIRAFNQDKPYDVFLNEQIAGDEIDAKTDDTPDRHRLPARRPARGRSARKTTRSGATSISTISSPRSEGACWASRSTARAATTTSSIRFRSGTTTAWRRRSSATSRRRIRWCRARKRRRTTGRSQDIDARQARAESRDQEDRGAVPNSELRQEAYKRFPEAMQRAIAKPEARADARRAAARAAGHSRRSTSPDATSIAS